VDSTPDPQPPPPRSSARVAETEEARRESIPGLEPELLVRGIGGKSHDAYAALRWPSYRLYAWGFASSSTGLQMLSTALGWEVYERTGSAYSLGLIGLARALPVILLALPGGHLADLYNRKRILVSTQTAFAILAGSLAVASFTAAPLWVYYILIGLTGCTRSLNGPTRQSILPLIVPPEIFHNAVTWNSGAFQFSAMAGPIMAGLLIAWTNSAWPVYVLCAVGCLVFAVSTAFIRFEQPTRGDSRFGIRSMLGGLNHLWHEKTILAAITLDLFAVLFGGSEALLPVFASKDMLNVGPRGLGALRAAHYLGAFLMALVIAHRPPFRHAGRALLLSVAGFGLATIGFGLSPLIPAPELRFPVAILMLLALGALDNISVVIRHVLVQVRTPDALRGRVAAVNSVFIESSNELGAYESGAVAALFRGGAQGSIISVVIGGVGTILVVLGVGWAWPQVRRLGALQPVEPQK
jgi:MFS family permease